MMHRCGSKPFREVLWTDFGAKDGEELPQLSALFKRTRQDKKGKLSDEAEIVSTEEENPSLLPFEIVEKCFGEQTKGNVVCFRAGLRPKHIRGPLVPRRTLQERLEESQRENHDLHLRLEAVERREVEREAERVAERKAREIERAAEKEKQDEFERKLNMFMSYLGNKQA